MAEIRTVEHRAQPTAGVRKQVPMTGLTEFFSRAFEETMAALQAQGQYPIGPPFGKYYGAPGETVDVEAGFPVAQPITPSGTVVPGELPEGRIVEAVHVGPFDTLRDTYAELERYMDQAKLPRAPVMWENYLSNPETEPDPANWRTEICWPIA